MRSNNSLANLKSSLDRFIVEKEKSKLLTEVNLKSSLDRFIAMATVFS